MLERNGGGVCKGLIEKKTKANLAWEWIFFLL